MISLLLKGSMIWTDAHIGTEIHLSYNDIQDVVLVQADGDELAKIISTFKNIPHIPQHEKLVQKWTGDHARFIAANW